MKGIIFTEFVEMVEDAHSPELADRIIQSSNLPSQGAYTSVGTYDHAEIIELVRRLSEETHVATEELLRTFGAHLFSRFVTLYPEFFEDTTTAFDFLERIEDHIHAEVKKLYSDAELPTFSTRELGREGMEMRYESRRPFAYLAHGLIEGCIRHFGEQVSVSMEDLSTEGRVVARFRLERLGN